MNENIEDSVYWVLNSSEEIAPIKKNVGGLANPDQMTAFVLNGYESDDGKNFENLPFEGGRMNGALILIDTSIADVVYPRVSRFVKSKGSINECVEDEVQHAVASWNLENDKTAILVLSSSANSLVQEALEKELGFFKVKLHRSLDASFSADFDVRSLLAQDYEINSDEMRSFMNKYKVQAPAPTVTAKSPVPKF